MKKIISLLTIFSIVFLNTQMVQATPTSDISNSIMKKYDLQTVQSTPKEIQPLSVANEKELEKLLNELDKAYKAAPTSDSQSQNFLQSTRVVNNKTLTHHETIFSLSNIGGKIVSNVNYTYLDSTSAL